MRSIVCALLLAATLPVVAAAAAPAPSPAIVGAVADPHRTPANVLRDRYRHPVETLGFFGVQPDQTVVEFLPSGGWYTEILAPMLSARGHYIGLVTSPKAMVSLSSMLTAGGARYAGATAAMLDTKAGTSGVPDGSADVVLTFRNVHNLIMGGGDVAANSFAAFFRMLKPGGTLGVEDHHLPEQADSALEMKSGYLKRSTILRLAEAAGFKFAGESAVNANPKDTHDWPQGVWTLPPTLQLGEVDRAKYQAVGESDRLTLRFVKPRG